MPRRKRRTVPNGHEGATEPTAPGAPANRDVVKPGWTEFQDGPPQDSTAQPPSEELTPAKPMIDRHR